MVTTAQSTPRTITSKSGMILPATIDPRTDFNIMDTCCIVYHVRAEHQVSYETLDEVKCAMRDASAVIVLYADAKGEIAARCLWPNAISLTKDNNIVARCYCTLRREVKTFRLDRMGMCHTLTTPDDMLCPDEAAA